LVNIIILATTACYAVLGAPIGQIVGLGDVPADFSTYHIRHNELFEEMPSRPLRMPAGASFPGPPDPLKPWVREREASLRMQSMDRAANIKMIKNPTFDGIVRPGDIPHQVQGNPLFAERMALAKSNPSNPIKKEWGVIVGPRAPWGTSSRLRFGTVPRYPIYSRHQDEIVEEDGPWFDAIEDEADALWFDAREQWDQDISK
jgi:hypothetical protein